MKGNWEMKKDVLIKSKNQILKDCIKGKGLSQSQFCKLVEKVSGRGISEQHLSGIICGKHPLTRTAAERFALVLEVTPEYLLGLSDYRTAEEARQAAINDSLTKAFHDFANRSEIISSLERVLEKLGFSGIEHPLNESEYSTLQVKFPPDYDATSDPNNPFAPSKYRVVRRESDGKIIFIPREKINEIIEEIIDFSFFKISREFL